MTKRRLTDKQGNALHQIAIAAHYHRPDRWVLRPLDAHKNTMFSLVKNGLLDTKKHFTYGEPLYNLTPEGREELNRYRTRCGIED